LGDAADDGLGKLQPDFVGGLFVLQQIAYDPEPPVSKSTGVQSLELEPNEAELVMRLAWQYGSPAEFLLNLARNFAGDPHLAPLVTAIAKFVPDGAPARSDWLAIIHYVLLATALSRADTATESILGVVEQQSKDPPGRAAYARSLFASALTGELVDHPAAEKRLQELRDLAAQTRDDAEVRRLLARGLVNAVNKAGTAERADSLVQELRGLAAQTPDDAEVRRLLASGLLNAFSDAGTAERADSLLQELRDLVAQTPDDAEVRRILARGLVNAVYNAGTAERADSLLQELRDLAAQTPDDAEVRRLLASGLFNAFSDAGTAERADSLLQELRDLAAQTPDHAEVRRPLARGLFNAFNKAGTAERADSLLQELRDLVAQTPDDAEVRRILARGLVNAANNAGTAERADSLLQELRDLAAQTPDDAEVRRLLASGLANAVINAGTGGRSESCLAELRALASNFPDDANLRDTTAVALLVEIGKDWPDEKSFLLVGVLFELISDTHFAFPNLRRFMAEIQPQLEAEGPEEDSVRLLEVFRDISVALDGKGAAEID
jgi:hypothetical protein